MRAESGEAVGDRFTRIEYLVDTQLQVGKRFPVTGNVNPYALGAVMVTGRQMAHVGGIVQFLQYSSISILECFLKNRLTVSTFDIDTYSFLAIPYQMGERRRRSDISLARVCSLRSAGAGIDQTAYFNEEFRRKCGQPKGIRLPTV